MIFAWLSRRPEDEQAYAFYLHGTIEERKAAASLIKKQHRKVLDKYKLDDTQICNAILGRSVRDVSAASGLSQYKAWKLRRDLAEIFEPVQMRLMTAMQEDLIDRQAPLD
jgi:hypothetical protein